MLAQAAYGQVGTGALQRSKTAARLSRLLIQAYLLVLPLWWVLGIDFIVPLLLSSALILASPKPHGRFTLSDCLLFGVILVLGVAAYVNGFLVARETTRFVAALYNLSLWISGLVLVQQARFLLEGDEEHRSALLRAAFWAFCGVAACAWASFLFAYAVGRFGLELPSGFGLVAGGAVPDSAPLIKQSTRLVFTRSDWGLPGVPMPRVVVYGPYPTATAAVIAVLGTLALLHLTRTRRAVAVPLAEALILMTLALTLTRSLLAGWLLGAVAGNLVFGTAWRRVMAGGLVALAVPLAFNIDFSDAVSYRSYSSESRFENYIRAVDETLMTNPVLGLGIKPREAGNHIAVGSHSTFVSSFTKGGALGLALALAYLVLLPAARWFGAMIAGDGTGRDRAELRILFSLQVALWVWLCFEDIDAPATAAMLIFLAFAFIEAALRPVRALR